MNRPGATLEPEESQAMTVLRSGKSLLNNPYDYGLRRPVVHRWRAGFPIAYTALGPLSTPEKNAADTDCQIDH
jgi:hypothetical protein